MSQERATYTAIFSHYEKVIKKNRKIYFRDLKTSPESHLIAEQWVLDEETSSKIIGHLTLGEIVSFTADKDLKNIKFNYPHGIKNE